MKLSERIRLLLKTAANDLFGEEQATEVRQTLNDETTAERLTGLLDDAQHQVDVLRLELENAVSHQKRINRAWQESLAQVKTLDAAADSAIQTGQDERARGFLLQLQSTQKHASELEELARSVDQRSIDLRLAVNQQQETLDALRRRALALIDREQSITAMADLLGDQQSLARQTEKLHHELSAWEEQIAYREDLLSARREWSQ
jgi:phage shock protein A